MAFELPPLPYAKTAFGDLISEETFNYHHGKHHNAYVSKTNDAIKGTDHEGKKLSQIIAAADGGLFNNAAQVWNHSFLLAVSLAREKGNYRRVEGPSGKAPSARSTISNQDSRTKRSAISPVAGPGWFLMETS